MFSEPLIFNYKWNYSCTGRKISDYQEDGKVINVFLALAYKVIVSFLIRHFSTNTNWQLLMPMTTMLVGYRKEKKIVGLRIYHLWEKRGWGRCRVWMELCHWHNAYHQTDILSLPPFWETRVWRWLFTVHLFTLFVSLTMWMHYLIKR